MVLAAIPSPTQGVWHLGLFALQIPLRAYALCIIAGIIVALALTLRRWRARGGQDDDLWDIAFWAILLGIVGGRLYHVITSYEPYFGSGGHPLDALRIWDGGLGIWGAVALGMVGGWIGARRKNVRLTVVADCTAPGLVLAQGIGRWGNWFNNELYGRATALPWKLQIHCWDLTEGKAVTGGTAAAGEPCPSGSDVAGYYHPTFLYESIWDVGLAVVLLQVDRRYKLGRGNLFALYAMGYTLGRVWVEALRIDEAHHILGLRLNVWTSVIVFALALWWFLSHGGLQAEQEATPNTDKHPSTAADETEPADGSEAPA